MSTRTKTAPVPAKITVYHAGDADPPYHTGNSTLDAYLKHEEDAPEGSSFSHNGWSLIKAEEKYDDPILYDNCLDNLGKRVIYLNESPYAHVGGLEATFFADDIESLKAFCRDWGFDEKKIQAPAAVSQTL